MVPYVLWTMVPLHTRTATRIQLRVSPPLARVVLALAALMQLVVLCGTPWTEGRPSSSIGAHVEQPGELHQIHDEDRCASCVVRHLMGDTHRVARAALAPVATFELPLRAATAWPVSERIAPDAPRAPPIAG
jgi:hypothetical protein